MPFTSQLSTEPNTQQAIDELCRKMLKTSDAKPDLALLFYSRHHSPGVDDLTQIVTDRLQPKCLLGCPGESIVAGGLEIENGPALCLWTAAWPNPVQLDPFRLTMEKTSEGYALLGWPDAFAEEELKDASMLLFGDPFTFPVDSVLQEMNQDKPGLKIMGGMASGARQPGSNPLICQNTRADDGAVGVLLRGEVGIRTVVSQGCRPIGNHMVITKANENLIEELGGLPVSEKLKELWEQMSEHDRELAQQGLHIGCVINEYQDKFDRGDFLVRNVMGQQQETGALAITDRVRVGQTVQFHVRDAQSADEDLNELLTQDQERNPAKTAAALLFSCNGRGTRLFDEPNHDASAVQKRLGDVPLAGFFAAGELGPVGGQNFIHGFTASLVLFNE